MSTRRLPDFETVAAARAAMNEAKAAHEAVHRIDVSIEVAADDPETAPFGADELLAELGQRWAAHDAPGGGTVARLKAIRAGLLPAAAADHEREHALERLLFDQYHALQDDPEWADVKAVLEPLYAERTDMFQTLSTAYHAVLLRRAGDANVAAMRALCPSPGGPHFVNVEVAIHTTRSIVESIVGTLSTFGIATAPPLPPDELVDDAAYVGYLASVDAWIAREGDVTATVGVDVDRQLARWNEINRLIEQHTG